MNVEKAVQNMYNDLGTLQRYLEVSPSKRRKAIEAIQQIDLEADYNFLSASSDIKAIS